MKAIKKIILFVFSMMSAPMMMSAKDFVVGHLMGQLGNQMFIVAATVSLALDYNAEPLFPGFLRPDDPLFKLPLHYEKVFFRLKAEEPNKSLAFTYREPEFFYTPIVFHPNMLLFGWYQSEKYFRHHKEEILDLLAPSQEIIDYLSSKYSAIINHPGTVSIHYRSYFKEDPDELVYLNQDKDYYVKAMMMFPEDAFFVVFSNDIEWCKSTFASIPRRIQYIEGETNYHDLYLMSFCKDHIICNSSFSWWGAYLNRNPEKIVIAPKKWFSPHYVRDTKDLLPEEWITQ